jgi:hypothetical protein
VRRSVKKRNHVEICCCNKKIKKKKRKEKGRKVKAMHSKHCSNPCKYELACQKISSIKIIVVVVRKKEGKKKKKKQCI